MSYQVKTDVFEGPFDLLVCLIQRSGMDIYDVNISEITDQYIAYVRSMEQIEPETAAEFMVLAATLLQIKSYMLLPGAEISHSEEEEKEPGREMAERIAEYRKYKVLAEYLRSREAEADRIFVKPREDISRYVDQPEEHLLVSQEQFIRAFQGFLEKRRQISAVRRRYEYAARERMTMEQKSEEICRCLKEKRRLSFEDLLTGESDEYDVVLTFITLLELSAQGQITVHQNSIFGQIEIGGREEVSFG